MARNTLKQRMIDRLPDGKHADGGGLYLVVRGESRRFYARFTYRGRAFDVPLGDAWELDLDAAREATLAAKRRVKAGLDPTSTTPSGAEYLENIVRAYYRDRWLPDAIDRRGGVGKYQNQWIEDFERHVFGRIGHVPIRDVRPITLVDCLGPIWREKHETAKKLLQRLTSVFDYALSLELIEVNPAPSAKVALGRVGGSGQHMAAMPWRWASDFYAYLRDERRQTPATLATRFLMLTAMRPGEIRDLRWGDVEPDDPASVGLPPAAFDGLAHGSRGLVILAPQRHKTGSKTGQAAVVVLSDEAQSVLAEARRCRRNHDADRLVFPRAWQKPDLPMSENALRNTLKKARDPRYREFTAHGFRSTLADGLAETRNITGEERRVLLHQSVGTKVDRAYFRSPMIGRSYDLLNSWADILTGAAQADVVDLTARRNKGA